MKGKKFKLKITTFGNEPVIKAKANKLDEFENIIRTLKQKYK